MRRLILISVCLAYGCSGVDSTDVGEGDAPRHTGEAGIAGIDGDMGVVAMTGNAGSGGPAENTGEAGSGAEGSMARDAGMSVTSCDATNEGTVLTQGEYGQCVYTDPCAETGRQTRTDSVCMNGVPTDIEVSEDCARDTDGTTLTEGQFGACAYEDECIKDGSKTRTDSVCVEGVATDTEVSEACERNTDGVVLTEGEFGACVYSDDCIESGRKSRTDSVCVEGVATDTVVLAACERETDGVVIAEGEFGACVYSDDCIETGRKSRTDNVCEGEVLTQTIVTNTTDCVQDTDASCGPVPCNGHADCAADEVCLCPGYWFDMDGERTCDDFSNEVVPRYCLPCAGRDGPACEFSGADPKYGQTYDSFCDLGGSYNYVYPGECPPECDPFDTVNTCSGAWSFCNAQGECENREPF